MKSGYEVQLAAYELLKALPTRDIGTYGLKLAKLSLAFTKWSELPASAIQSQYEVNVYTNKMAPSIGWLCSNLISEIEVKRKDVNARCLLIIQEMHSILKIDTTKLIALDGTIITMSHEALQEITADCFLDYLPPA